MFKNECSVLEGGIFTFNKSYRKICKEDEKMQRRRISKLEALNGEDLETIFEDVNPLMISLSTLKVFVVLH